jgi:hypothetical protein
VAASPDPALDRATIQAVAREVAAILGGGGRRLLTAQQVAERFNVDRGWVYAHADELGVIRLGEGPRPRLRFDAAVVARLLVATRGREITRHPSTSVTTGVPLLPIRRPRTPNRSGGH